MKKQKFALFQGKKAAAPQIAKSTVSIVQTVWHASNGNFVKDIVAKAKPSNEKYQPKSEILQLNHKCIAEHAKFQRKYGSALIEFSISVEMTAKNNQI